MLVDLGGECPGTGCPRRRTDRASRPLPDGRSGQRRPDRLRGQRELEGHRRELQRMPSLPGNPSPAERALELHERRETSTAKGHGAVARCSSLPKTQRRWPGRAATPAAGPGSRDLTEADDRTILYFALFPNALVSMHPDYVMLHTLYPRGTGKDRRDLRMVLREDARSRRRTSIRPMRSSSGTRPTGRTGTSAN